MPRKCSRCKHDLVDHIRFWGSKTRLINSVWCEVCCIEGKDTPCRDYKSERQRRRDKKKEVRPVQ